MTTGKVWHIKYLIVNNVLQFGIYISMYHHSMRSHPAQFGETFDGPPTLERSGSEHRRAVTSFLLRRKAWLEVELSLQERRRGRKVSTKGGHILSSLREERLGEKGGAFLKGKEGRVGFRKNIIYPYTYYRNTSDTPQK